MLPDTFSNLVLDTLGAILWLVACVACEDAGDAGQGLAPVGGGGVGPAGKPTYHRHMSSKLRSGSPCRLGAIRGNSCLGVVEIPRGAGDYSQPDLVALSIVALRQIF